MPENPWSRRLSAAPFYLSWGAAVAVMLSIAASQILLGMAVLGLAVGRVKPRLPRVAWLLGLFLAVTLVALAFSTDPASGRPQIRKFFVYLMLLVVFSTFRKLVQARYLVFSWAVVGTAASGLALAQFGAKVLEARAQGSGFYQHYVGDRITGFMSHWMTFSGEAMLALVLIAAYLLFAQPRDHRLWWAAAAGAAFIGGALLLSFTRAAWLGAAAGVIYLVWFGKRKLLWALPAVALVMLAIPAVRERLVSTVRPQGELDSNSHRIVCWRTGVEMIQAHPWLGLGPEMVGKRFEEYVPKDMPRPLPVGWYGHLHNIYLQYAAERGIPAALVLTAMLLLMLYDFGRALRHLPPGPGDARFLLQGASAAVIAIMVSGLFEHNLGDSEVLAMFLAVAAAGYLAVEAASGKLAPETEEAARAV